jgi:hypothetical protein
MRLVRIPVTLVAVIAAACLAMLGPAVATAGAASPPVSYQGGCTLVLSQVTVTQGGQLQVTAEGYPSGAVVTFTLHSTTLVDLGSATADANGNATLAFTLPADTPAGMHAITASGVPAGQCDPEVSTNLMVLAQSTTNTSTSAGSLPRTGTNSFELLQIALILIAIGGLITLATRKRLQRGHAES